MTTFPVPVTTTYWFEFPYCHLSLSELRYAGQWIVIFLCLCKGYAGVSEVQWITDWWILILLFVSV